MAWSEFGPGELRESKLKYQVVGVEDSGEHVAFTVIHETGLVGDGLMTKVATYTAPRSLPVVSELMRDVHEVAGVLLEFYGSSPKSADDLEELQEDDGNDELVLG